MKIINKANKNQKNKDKIWYKNQIKQMMRDEVEEKN
jgi:hypothetical protein